MALKPALSRDPCWRCGVPGFKGCEHFAPCELVVPTELRDVRYGPRASKVGFKDRAA